MLIRIPYRYARRLQEKTREKSRERARKSQYKIPCRGNVDTYKRKQEREIEGEVDGLLVLARLGGGRKRSIAGSLGHPSFNIHPQFRIEIFLLSCHLDEEIVDPS
jgi:hypothetical protein